MGNSKGSNYYIAAIPAFVILCIFTLVPFLISLIISFKEYNPATGIMNSPWVADKNYASFLDSQPANNAIINTLRISFLSTLVGAGFVSLMVFCISRLGRFVYKVIALTIIVIPSLIPTTVILKTAMDTPLGRMFSSVSLYPYAAVLYEVLCITPIFIVFGVFGMVNRVRSRPILFVTACYVAIRILGFLSPDIQFIFSTYSPKVYTTGDVLDTLIYRTSLMNGQFSSGGAMYIIKLLLQIIASSVSFFILSAVFSRMKATALAVGIDDDIQPKPWLVTVICIIPLALSIFFIKSTFGIVNVFEHDLVGVSFVTTIVVSLISCVMVGILIISLGYGLSNNSIGILLICVVAMTLQNNIIGQFLVSRIFGMVGTVYPMVIVNMMYCTFGALLLYMAVGGQLKRDFSRFVHISTGPLIALLALFFSMYYKDSITGTVYATNPTLRPISLVIRELYISRESPYTNTIVIALIPITVGVLGVLVGFVKTNSKGAR